MPYAVAGDVRLYYEETGQGEPLLFLHGLGSQTSDWRLQTPVFAEYYRAIIIDMRGHGRSEKPPGPYSIPLMAADIACVVRQIDVDSVHVVGLSMGGMVAFQLAIDEPNLVRSLVVVNSVPSLAPRSVRERAQIWWRQLLAYTLGPGLTGRFLSRRLFPKEEHALFRRLLAEQWAQNDRRSYIAAMNACLDWDVADRIDRICCPTLILSGEHDYLPLDAKQNCARRISGAEFVVIEDSRHATPVDQAQRFNEIVLDFLWRETDQAITGLR